MEKLLTLSLAGIAISIVGIATIVFLYNDFQSALKDSDDQLESISSRLDELESTVANTGLVAHWRLDEAGGAATNDNSENGNTASLENDPSWQDKYQCAVGDSCLGFDGIDDYVRGPEESMRIAYQWTTSGWIQLDSHGSFNIVLTKMGSSNGHVNYEMKIDNQGHLVCRSHNEAGDNFQSTSVQSLSLDTWYNIACDFDGTRLRGWINGSFDGATSVIGNLCTQCVIGTPGPFVVGHAGANSGCPNCVSEYFNGIIDDVRVYSRALNGSEIQKLFQERLV